MAKLFNLPNAIKPINRPSLTFNPQSRGGLNPQQGTYNPQRTVLNRGGMFRVPSLKKGGKIKKTGIYKLHKGEKVITKKGHQMLEKAAKHILG